MLVDVLFRLQRRIVFRPLSGRLSTPEVLATGQVLLQGRHITQLWRSDPVPPTNLLRNTDPKNMDLAA